MHKDRQLFLHLDCRYYIGDRPCQFHRLCDGCPHYEPMGPRVLIVKLGALGDVVRTAALLPGLTQLTTDPPYVTWLTSPPARPLVERMPGVHRVLSYGEEAIARLRVERFDVILSLDKEPGPCGVAMSTPAFSRLGIGLSRYGTPYPINDEADYYFELGLNNEEKFYNNEKSYQQLIYEALGMIYGGERYELDLTLADRQAAQARFESFGLTPEEKSKTQWIGLNPGAGGVFANKDWPESNYIDLIKQHSKDHPEARYLLLGGEREADLLTRIQSATDGLPVYSGGIDNDLGSFAALIDRCDVLICGDTLAMHLAIARRRRVITLFGPTCHQEIDLFGRGTKIVTPIECSPCYLRECDISPHCQDLIPVEKVLEALTEQLATTS